MVQCSAESGAGRRAEGLRARVVAGPSPYAPKLRQTALDTQSPAATEAAGATEPASTDAPPLAPAGGPAQAF